MIELQLLREAVVRGDRDDVACSGGGLIRLAVGHGNGMQGLVLCGKLYGVLGHHELDDRRLLLFLRQGNARCRPARKLRARRCILCRCDDLIALDSLSCGSAIDGVGALIHRDGLDCLVLRFHGHIALEHLEGGLSALEVCEGHAAVLHFPVVELAARDGVGRNGDLRALYCLRQRCHALFCRDGVQLIVACLQLHILVRHGECGSVVCCAANQLCIRDAADNLPPHELIARSGTVIGGHSDRLACIGLVIRHIHGCMGQGNSPRHNGRNVHSICFCVDGRTTRVNRHAALSSRVDVLAAGIDDAVCHAARALVLDGDRDRARDRNIARHNVVSITLTRDRHLGGLFHRHIAGHGVAFFTSNFHLAVTADLNSVEDGKIVLARDLDVLCICDRQFAKYNWIR